MTSAGFGALAAVTASSLFSVGLVLQSDEARKVPEKAALGLSFLLQLARRPRWLLGALVILIGFGFHVTALTLAPISVVQPALAAGLLVLLAVGLKGRGGRATPKEIAGVAGIILGVVAVTVTAPARATDDAGDESIALALGALAVAIFIPHVLALVRSRRDENEGGLLATFSAGASYAMTGLTTKLFSDDLADELWVSAWFWLGITALVAAFALVDQTTALQRRTVVEVGPIVFVIPVVIPVLLAPALVGEGWSNAPHGVAPLVLSLLLVCVSAAALAGSPTVAHAAAAPEQEPA
jgi:drug/metabolite transporter (DMT)-like permease